MARSKTTEEADGLPPLPAVEALSNGAAIVVTGPKKGRWRSGLYFGPAPTELQPQDFQPATDEPPHRAAQRLHAILTDPRLNCVARLEDGTEEAFSPEAIEALRAAIDASSAPAELDEETEGEPDEETEGEPDEEAEGE